MFVSLLQYCILKTKGVVILEKKSLFSLHLLLVTYRFSRNSNVHSTSEMLTFTAFFHLSIKIFTSNLFTVCLSGGRNITIKLWHAKKRPLQKIQSSLNLMCMQILLINGSAFSAPYSVATLFIQIR